MGCAGSNPLAGSALRDELRDAMHTQDLSVNGGAHPSLLLVEPVLHAVRHGSEVLELREFHEVGLENRAPPGRVGRARELAGEDLEH